MRQIPFGCEANRVMRAEEQVPHEDKLDVHQSR